MEEIPWNYLNRLEMAIRRLADAVEDGEWNGLRKEINDIIGESAPNK